ncbi:C13 family peptidase [Tahibacter amnicola]|uniref:C13 family peptidase n=1 Tax=Tahibacter amnicola TaxID=2976241 RepID=A0ABY6BAL3_9GAMM|nr:C13 family peptidase [Tahibacter amnicola]UXI67101.1 C13 family peptidase [Tahibacter amnicola]
MSSRDLVRLLLTLLMGVLVGLAIGNRTGDRATPAVRTPAPLPVPPPAPELAGPPALENPLSWLRQHIFSGDEAPHYGPDYSAEAVMYNQHNLMHEALAALAPQVPGKTDLYLIAFGGDGSENVFRNEVEYVDKLFTRRFAAKGRVLALQNSRSTLDSRPLATYSNLQIALDGLSTVMDPDEDILAVFMTSHGSEDHVLYVGMDDLPLDQIGDTDLAHLLGEYPFRWKVVIVSACYSGGFVSPLKNATTMVITASRADRPSFGCGTGSDITYFGRAFFVEGLNQADTFRGAFQIAQRLVADWEKADGEEPSEPQMASTPLIEAKLKEWRAGFVTGETVPFAPADAGSSKPAAQASAISAK